MSVSLEEALSQVELEEGKTYECRVNGRKVLVRVVESLPPSSQGIDENDVMLDPWVELPAPKPTFRGKAKLGKLPKPDAPVIPRDEEELP